MVENPENSSDTSRADLPHRLVGLLREDARMSITAMADRLSTPRAVVAHEVETLIASRIIRIVAAANPSFLGQHVIAHVSVEPRGPVRPIADFISTFDEAVLVTAVAGNHALVAEFRTGTHEALHALLSQVRSHANVARIDTLIYSRVRKGYHSHGETPKLRVDADDRIIMSILQRDGRATYTAIADHVSLTPTTVRARIQRLVDADVIKFGVVESRGIPGRQVSVGFGINTSDNLEPLISHLAKHPGVEFTAECVGRHDVIGTFVGKDLQAIHSEIEALLELPNIDRFAAWTHLRTYKEDYSRQV